MNRSSLVKFFKSLRGAVAMTFVLAITASSYFLYDVTNQLKHMTHLSEGVQTCFTRVNQSYTAKVIGDASSMYLDKSFINVTDECFAEAISYKDAYLASGLSKVALKLNSISKDVSWFGQRLQSAQSSSLSKSSGISSLSNRFQKIEASKESIEEQMDFSKESLYKTAALSKLSLMVMGVILPILLAFEIFETRKRRKLNEKIEEEAQTELDSSEYNQEKTEVVLKTALEQNELPICSELLSRFSNEAQKNAADTVGVTGFVNSSEDLEEQIERIWTASDEELETPNDFIIENRPYESLAISKSVETSSSLDLNLETETNIEEEVVETKSTSLSDVLDKLVAVSSSKLFTQGISLDIQVKEGIFIQEDEETAEQVLFNALQAAISSFKTKKEDELSFIKVVSTVLGENVSVRVLSNGEAFNNEIVEFDVGLKKEVELPVDLEIVREVCQSLGIEVSFKNEVDKDFNPLRCLVFSFKKHEKTDAPKPQLVSLKVGTKKEVLRELRESIQ